jgi:hypothetical protein
MTREAPRRVVFRLSMKSRNLPGELCSARNLPRHLRTHDALTVGEPFLPGRSRHSGLLPRQLLVAGIPTENDRYFFDATSGPNIYSKRSSLLPDSPATALSGCLDRYDSASVSWGDACPIGFFAAFAWYAGSVCEVSFVSGEPALPLIQVVRFSRLIGKIDTTGSRTAAQVAPPRTLGYSRNCVSTLWCRWFHAGFFNRTRETPLF